MNLRICVLKGGTSPEREISLKSGTTVEKALKKIGYDVFSIDVGDGGKLCSLRDEKIDLVFIALHGPGGEDGTVQGWLEVMGIPYTGSGVLASALAMDKSVSRKIWESEGLKQPSWQRIDSFSFSLDIFPPLVVKPARSGSTIGVTLVREKREIEPALKLAFKYDNDYVLIEEYIEGREITVGIIDDPEPRALPVIEIIHRETLYDYRTKYTEGLCEYAVPARFSSVDTMKIQETALKAYKILGCRDFGRVDMIWRSGDIYVLEVNTIPGMTEKSLLPRAARAEGMKFEQVVDKIIQRALKRRFKSET